MKTLLKFSFIICALCLLAACGKDNASNDTVNFKTTIDVSLTITINKSHLSADGIDQAIVTVRDKGNVDVTSSCIIYVNDKAIAKNIFTTATPGSYQVKAVRDGAASAIINLLATSNSVSVFTQKVVAEFYTGTWCGICPGTLIPLENYTNYNPNVIMVGIHGPSGSNDPYQYIYDTQLRNTFGVGGVPTVILNRNGQWDGNNTTLDNLSKISPPLGIGLETTGAGNNISIKASVKFGQTITAPLKIVIMLVEDGLAHDQTNYGHFGLPNPIVNFSHRNVLRSTATDIFGDVLPITQQTKDNVWQKSYTASSVGYDISKCRIVAFVLYDTNSQNLKGALNAQVVNVGQTINF